MANLVDKDYYTTEVVFKKDSDMNNLLPTGEIIFYIRYQ